MSNLIVGLDYFRCAFENPIPLGNDMDKYFQTS